MVDIDLSKYKTVKEFADAYYKNMKKTLKFPIDEKLMFEIMKKQVEIDSNGRISTQ